MRCHFLHFFHFFPRLNRKTRFSRSEILKNLNICPSKDRHLTCYTCYRFYDFLQYGLMDLVKSFFKWCMIYNFNRKSQKALMSCHFIPETELFRKQVAELCFQPLYITLLYFTIGKTEIKCNFFSLVIQSQNFESQSLRYVKILS